MCFINYHKCLIFHFWSVHKKNYLMVESWSIENHLDITWTMNPSICKKKRSVNQWLDDTTPRFLYDDTTVVLNGIVSEDYKGEQQEPFVKV